MVREALQDPGLVWAGGSAMVGTMAMSCRVTWPYYSFGPSEWVALQPEQVQRLALLGEIIPAADQELRDFVLTATRHAGS